MNTAPIVNAMRFWNFIVSCIAIPASSTAFANPGTAPGATLPPPSTARPSHRARRLRRASRAARRVTP